jgi:hypothetical protein
MLIELFPQIKKNWCGHALRLNAVQKGKKMISALTTLWKNYGEVNKSSGAVSQCGRRDVKCP